MVKPISAFPCWPHCMPEQSLKEHSLVWAKSDLRACWLFNSTPICSTEHSPVPWRCSVYEHWGSFIASWSGAQGNQAGVHSQQGFESSAWWPWARPGEWKRQDMSSEKYPTGVGSWYLTVRLWLGPTLKHCGVVIRAMWISQLSAEQSLDPCYFLF